MRKANLYAVMTAAAVSMAILSGCSGSQTAATTAAETTTVAETTAEETTAEAIQEMLPWITQEIRMRSARMSFS